MLLCGESLLSNNIFISCFIEVINYSQYSSTSCYEGEWLVSIRGANGADWQSRICHSTQRADVATVVVTIDGERNGMNNNVCSTLRDLAKQNCKKVSFDFDTRSPWTDFYSLKSIYISDKFIIRNIH